MDVQLLLTIQSECNACGVALPWDAIGSTLGIGTSGGAIIQHLAKTRSRRVAAGLPVPPPLRRGGGTPKAANASGSKVAAASQRQNLSAKRIPPKWSQAPKKKRSLENDDDEDEDESDGAWNSDSDGDYGNFRSKRLRNIRRRPIKGEDSSDGEEQSPNKVGEKRKRGNNSGVQSPTSMLRIDSSTRNSGQSKTESQSSSDGVFDEDSSNDQAACKSGFVGAGSKFFTLEDDNNARYQTSGKTIPRRQSLVVKLPIGRSQALAVLRQSGKRKDSENYDSCSESAGDNIDQSINNQYEAYTPIGFDAKDRPRKPQYRHHHEFSGSTLHEDEHSQHSLSFAHEDASFENSRGIGAHPIFGQEQQSIVPQGGSDPSSRTIFGSAYDFHDPYMHYHEAIDNHCGAMFHHGLPVGQHAISDPFQGWEETGEGFISADGGYKSYPNLNMDTSLGSLGFDSNQNDVTDGAAFSAVSPAALHRSPVGRPVVRPTVCTSMSSGPSTTLATPGSGLTEQEDIFAGADFDNFIHEE